MGAMIRKLGEESNGGVNSTIFFHPPSFKKESI